MKNYLSFGAGRNSVAMYMYMLDQKIEFEAVFVDHGTDWPETYEYLEMFRQRYPVTIIKPRRSLGNGRYVDNLYDFCWEKKMFPSRQKRWCTVDFKNRPLNKYHGRNCVVNIGFDFGEKKRAKIYFEKGREYKYPLIEAEIGLEGCKQIIQDHGLPLPLKSGCFICPFQWRWELRELRRFHPNLLSKLEQLEDRNNEERARRGFKPYYSFGRPVREFVERDINQMKLWPEDELPPR